MNNVEDFAEFLSLPEDERFEYLICKHMNIKISLWQKLEIKLINKWWTSMMKNNPHIPPRVLFESITKGRF